ncbi:ABC transporter substrate-binding protein [Alteromonas sediminis]|uniref:ABC transporter substrate-binding protein n=1 Tax=Alteromonas sediminis TaxID=2259342 RepID=A0A3N5XWJ7_9ALTE|nr:ABC transporter substrate-binding protein [Alteromonas sediminis]RPJ65042.1 ABC transporter substrate-binding protein [Alteromonas sediminis]
MKNVTFGIVLTLLLLGCTEQSDWVKAQSAIIYCSESDPVTFNPQLDTGATTSDATAHQIYSRLLDFDPETGQIVPALASSWSISNDGLVYIFQLRKDVNFHMTRYFTPSRTFNADDVIFSFNRWRDPAHPYHRVSGGQYPYFDSLGLADNIEDIKRINGYRIEIHLKQRDSSFIAHLATDFSVILSAEYGDHLLSQNKPEKIDRFPIGTGPFKFVSYQRGQAIRYRAHAGYWGQTQTADTLIFDITQKSSLRMAKLITGECDAIAFPSQSELSVIRERADLTLTQQPALNIGFWAFNTQKPPFDNPDVRRALAYAIDKNTLLETVYLGNATRAKTLVPSASWAFHESSHDTAYNPVLSRQLLDRAKIPRGFTMTIWAMPVERSYNPNARKMAELLQQYLADVGINAQIITYDWNTFREKLGKGEHQSVLIGWSADNGDPDNFYRPLLSCDAIPSGTNRAMWCNEEYDRLIYSALQTDDVEARQAIYEDVNELLYENLPLIPIAHALRYQVYRNELKGLRINPYGGVRFAGVIKAQ